MAATPVVDGQRQEPLRPLLLERPDVAILEFVRLLQMARVKLA
jgi:hypothetical protein